MGGWFSFGGDAEGGGALSIAIAFWIRAWLLTPGLASLKIVEGLFRKVNDSFNQFGSRWAKYLNGLGARVPALDDEPLPTLLPLV
jgi:hypothetical protein